VATKLVFTNQPAPASIPAYGNIVAFTTIPVVSAVDGSDVVDTGYSTDIILAEINGAGTVVLTGNEDNDANNATVTRTPTDGVVSFDGLQINYSLIGTSNESFNLNASSGGLSSTN